MPKYSNYRIASPLHTHRLKTCRLKWDGPLCTLGSHLQATTPAREADYRYSLHLSNQLEEGVRLCRPSQQLGKGFPPVQVVVHQGDPVDSPRVGGDGLYHRHPKI